MTDVETRRFTEKNGYELDTSPIDAEGEQAFIFTDTKYRVGEVGRVVVTRDLETVAGEYKNRLMALVAIMREDV